jgi:hypothetical protein
MHRLKGLLASQGVHVPFDKDFLVRLEEARIWDGTPVPDIERRLIAGRERIAPNRTRPSPA